MDGFQEVFGCDALRPGEVRDGAGDPQDSVEGPGGEGQFFHGLLEEVALGTFKRCVLAQF